jgi:hypothetical protein
MSKTLVRALRKEAVSTAKNKAWEQSKIRESQAKEEIEALGDSEIGGTDVAPKSQEDPKASTLGYGRAIYEYKAQNSEEIELREVHPIFNEILRDNRLKKSFVLIYN